MARLGHCSEIVAALKGAGLRRGYLVSNQNGVGIRTSHSVLDGLGEFLERNRFAYAGHDAVFLQTYKDSLFGAFIYRTIRGQACGGVRMREYDDASDFVFDGLRLSVGMGRKSSLAGLWWGGGKSVIGIGRNKEVMTDRHERRKLMKSFGSFLTSLRGAYVAAKDSGITTEDMNTIFENTRFTTCISPELGGSGSPSGATAVGVVCGMEASLDVLGLGTLQGKSIAVQGVGSVGEDLVKLLFEKGAKKVIASDVSAARIESVRKTCSAWLDKLELHNDPEFPILEQDVDIVSPCAFGGVLHEHSVPRIKAKIVCGAANNQLVNPASDYGMKAAGITYAVDYIVNRMGIVSCADEPFGYCDLGMNDPRIQRHLTRTDPESIYNVLKKVIETSIAEGRTTVEVADQMADRASAVPHPIFGHRSRAIIDGIVSSDWCNGG